jgi:catechol 2,3-dioxygenase-like lactoylglutathione lyase family enzyme
VVQEVRVKNISRRTFVTSAVAAAAVAGGVKMSGQQQATNRVSGYDHVALPMLNTDAMILFYKTLGFDIRESAAAVSVYAGRNMINFHRPARWQDSAFTLRAPAAKPPCGDLCFVWDGTAAQLKTWLDAANARVEEGPVARQGGRKAEGTSVYTRDPDGNLLEFIIYS